MTIEELGAAVSSGAWALTRHARERAGKRYISDESLVHILAGGEMLEDYPEDPRGASSLVLGRDEGGRPLHAVCSLTHQVPWL
jgi:hypothetical protein